MAAGKRISLGRLAMKIVCGIPKLRSFCIPEWIGGEVVKLRFRRDEFGTVIIRDRRGVLRKFFVDDEHYYFTTGLEIACNETT